MEEQNIGILNIFKGINLKTLSAISSLINSYSKKKKLLFSFMIIFLIIMFAGTMYELDLYEMQARIIKMCFIGLVFIPVIFLCLFSIPSTISQMHSTTLIKRIGSTRLNERGYILTIWIIFFIRAIIYFLISLVFWTIVISSTPKFWTGVEFEELHLTSRIIFSILIENSFTFITFSIIYIMFLTSFGILLGMIPIGQISKGILSLFLFASILIFGNIFTPMGFFLNEKLPIVSILFTILDPLTLLSVIMESLYSGSLSIVYSIAYYIVAISLTMSTFLLASTFISFNKVK